MSDCEWCRICTTPHCPQCGKDQAVYGAIKEIVVYLERKAKRITTKTYLDPNEPDIGPRRYAQRKQRLMLRMRWQRWADALTKLLAEKEAKP